MRSKLQKTVKSTTAVASQLTSTDLENSETKPAIEFYLGEDILQGEKVPFYFLWKDASIDKIKLQYTGFKSIVRLFNVSEHEKIDGGAIIRK
ncbi:MAG: hypothetical protein LBE76_08495 [Nitrososphaerota archaeon]|jgi:hypothetical protein|nr:hypothetical protein [Nitrososphaerota archaeon]